MGLAEFPGQLHAVVDAGERAGDGIASRRFTLGSNTGTVDGVAGGNEVTADVSVCVPRNGSADIRLTASASSPIYGDPPSEVTMALGREGGVLVTRIYLSGQVGPPCRV